MAKNLAKKLDDAEATLNANPSRGGGKFKKWTNNPELQDQASGRTTAAGKADKAKTAKLTGVDQGEDEPAPKTRGFTKVSQGGAKAKAGAAAKGAKSARAPKAPAGPDTRKLTLVEKNNPKREGSAAHDRYELYRKAKTAQAFLDAGGTAGDLAYDAKKGFIKLA